MIQMGFELGILERNIETKKNTFQASNINWSTFVHTEKYISLEVQNLTGIKPHYAKNSPLKGAPNFIEAISQLKNWTNQICKTHELDQFILTGFNISLFDLPLLYMEMRRSSFDFFKEMNEMKITKIIEVRNLVQKVSKEEWPYSLTKTKSGKDSLSQISVFTGLFNRDYEQHTATSDVKALQEIFSHPIILSKLEPQDITSLDVHVTRIMKAETKKMDQKKKLKKLPIKITKKLETGALEIKTAV